MDAALDAFWNSLQRRLARLLAEQAPRGAKVVYLEYPIHANVGDLTIFLGTEHWLRRSGAHILGRWRMDNFRFPRLTPDVVLLCHGGGNMGDLYPRIQAFREKVVAAYPSNAILFLPQTIHYQNPAGLEASAKVLNRHANLTLLLRDSRSLTIARTHFPQCHTALVPDMAVWLHPLAETLKLGDAASPRTGTLYLLRKDMEQCEGQDVPQLGAGWTGDWGDLLGSGKARVDFARRAARHTRTIGADRLYAAWWHAVARSLVRSCASRFLGAETVVTSRLHGHILASLLGVSNILLDNSYGKNGAYFETWHRSITIARFQGDAACRVG
jgi:pyruvyl transferase EpsO